MKRFLPILIVIVLAVSLIGMTIAYAGVSISGNSEVLKGKTYTYTVKVTASGIYMMGNVKCDGVFSGSTVQFDAGSGSSTNQSLSASVKITVKVSSSATPGQTGRIYIDNASYSYYDDENNIKEKSLSGSKTATVVVAAPPATKDPNATPKPLEGWEIVEAAVDEAQQGAVVEGVMEDDYDIPEDLLNKLVKNGNTLKIDFGTYTCTIDPANLTDFEDIGKLSLKLDFEKLAGLTEIAEGKDVYQLHFGHVGELPGKLKFTFKATENQPGDVVYLYYHYGEANVIEGNAMAVVDEDGMLTFEIYHCSSYFVTGEVIEGAMSNFDTESQTKIEELNTSLEEMQTQLDDADAQIVSLTEQNTVLTEDLEAAQQQADEFEDMASKALAAEPEAEETDFSLVVLIAAVAAAVMLSILLTMLITRSGLFRKTADAQAAAGQGYQPEPMQQPTAEPVEQPAPFVYTQEQAEQPQADEQEPQAPAEDKAEPTGFEEPHEPEAQEPEGDDSNKW